MPGQTQIVLQWLDTAEDGMDLQEIYKIEDALEAASGGKYFVDGHECGQRHTCSSMPKTPRST